MEVSAVRPLAGWGRFPVETCRVFRPERRAAVARILTSDAAPHYIARGLGRSYGDTALNAGGAVLDLTRLDRFLAFDPEAGLLEAEGGVSLGDIVSTFLPRGWFLPVTPGTKHVTLAGAIANDVHGKNHHKVGTMGAFVLDLKLLTARGEILTCSHEENADVFHATLGGIGLTGIILSARIRLLRVDTASLVVDYRKVRNVDEALEALAESDRRYDYSVAWIDALARGGALGRSILMSGNHARREDLRGPGETAVRADRGVPVPFDLPSGLLNRHTVGLFNAAYYRLHPGGPGHLSGFGPFFYPLDALRDWNRLYGSLGFVQYQAVFPPATSREGIVDLLTRFSASGRASFLAVLKRFGPQGPGLLSFPTEGYTLALDVPVSRGLVEFLRGLDEVVLAHGGRLYLAKDATMTAGTFAAMYPRLAEFRAVKERLDPEHRLSSSQARRLGIVAESR